MDTKRILVVDDERIVAEDISESLTRMGCEVIDTALSGPEAIEKAGRHRPDLIMMDIVLQGEMDGVEAAQTIRDEYNISCVFLTAYSDDGVLNRAKLTQPAGYIVKPFDEAGLRSTVEIALYKVDTERALRESQEWFATTLMSIGDGVVATDAEGNIQFMNPVAERLSGTSTADIVGKPLSHYFPIRDERNGQAIENPALVALRTGKVVGLQKGCILERPDRSLIPIDDSGAPIRNAKGEVIGSVLVFRDITETRNWERKIVDYQGHLEKLVEQRTEKLTAEVDERRRAEFALAHRVKMETLVSSISSAFLARKGVELEDGINSALVSLGEFLKVDATCLFTYSPDRQSMSCTYEWCSTEVPSQKDILRNIPTSALSWLNPRIKAGEEIVIADINQLDVDARMEREIFSVRGAQSLLIVPLMSSDAPVGFVVAIATRQQRQWLREDLVLMKMLSNVLVSALKRQAVEADKTKLQTQLNQSQKMEAVGKLSGGIAHDFNNMLLPIIGYSDMILERLPEGDPTAAEIQEIRKAAERAAKLTRQLLAFSRRQIIKKTNLDLNNAIHDIQNMLVRIIGEDIRLTTELDEGIAAVRADPGQIEQVLMNLVVNARDAMPQGGHLKVSTGSIAFDGNVMPVHSSGKLEGDYVCIKVTDSGVGMSDEILDRIFEPFFSTKGADGTGLGLSVIYGIIEQHGGGISVESRVGYGTSFSIYLPAISEPKPAPERDVRANPDSSKGQGEKILLVEDEEGVIRFVSTALRKNGYDVIEAMTIRDAVATFEEHDGVFDLVFSDAVLPDGNGLDMLDKFMDDKPGTRALLSSGYTDKHSLMKKVKEKEISFLQKPYSLPQLFKTVREVLTDAQSHLLS